MSKVTQILKVIHVSIYILLLDKKYFRIHRFKKSYVHINQIKRNMRKSV